MIELREPTPPATEADLAAAERALAALRHPLPPSYRAFLAEHDGGTPVRSVFTFEQDNEPRRSVVDGFLGVAPVEPPLSNLTDTARTLGERLLPGVVPIADDPFGNLVCIDAREGDDGPIVFWDHEYEGDPPDAANLYPVAPDLATFLESLRPPGG